MKYRRVGNTGLKVSEVSLGSWMTYGESVDRERSKQCLVTALENGVNFIDTADIYAKGEAERIIGEVLAEETYRRRDLVISTKAFWAMSDDVNDRGGSRKHLMESINDSLDRLNLDYVDIFFLHCYDRKTNLAETIGTMSDIVREGKAHYWGTSGFLAYQLERTVSLAREMKAYPPKVEQPRYNMMDRYIELEISEVCKDNNIGIVVWSPLMYGILTGKYNEGIPTGSRFDADENMRQSIQQMLEKDNLVDKLRKLADLASQLEVKFSQLALAWILRREEIASVITGATKLKHIRENVEASNVNLSSEVLAEIEAILDDKPAYPYAHDGGPEEV